MSETNQTRKPWGAQEKQSWFKKQMKKRSYRDEVLSKIESLKGRFEISKYGALPISEAHYPLFLVKTKNWSDTKKTVLITGGVHGYETSGVQGALRFMEDRLADYTVNFNFVIAPCVSPWGYETINRWNPSAIDPNRSFYENSPAEECAALMRAVAELNVDFLAHFDLHETTDTDRTVFRPALEARDGKAVDTEHIPDGFYTVGDTENPVDGFQKAIIDSVREVTHIAQPDSEGQIIGKPITQEGVINYPKKELSLCPGFTNSRYPTTTEVYPDSPKATPEDCIRAQVAALVGGLDYLVANEVRS